MIRRSPHSCVVNRNGSLIPRAAHASRVTGQPWKAPRVPRLMQGEDRQAGTDQVKGRMSHCRFPARSSSQVDQTKNQSMDSGRERSDRPGKNVVYPEHDRLKHQPDGDPLGRPQFLKASQNKRSRGLLIGS